MNGLLMSLGFIAIVVPHSPPPPPATGTQQSCKYSIREYSDTYVCYSESEYQSMLAQRQADSERASAEFLQSVTDTLKWTINHWWQVILSVLGGIVALMAFGIVWEAWQQKRHPEQYDQYGFRKDWYL